MNTKKLFNKDFTLMILGQIISIFGNNILRFALPLYLLNVTGSPALLGIVSAVAFIPMIALYPIGGMFADRVNKRNVMVILDFFTAILCAVFLIALGRMNLTALMMVTILLLYGIQALYQPAVQASIPVLAGADHILKAGAVVNQVNALASLIGPVLGGLIFGLWGLKPIMVLGAVCFAISAVMEIFIHIPFQKQVSEEKVLSIIKGDFKEGIRYILKERKELSAIVAVVAAFNLFYTSMFLVGLPVIITQGLGFSEKLGNQLYGYTQGVVGAGSLAGGIIVGVLADRLKMKSLVPLLATAVAAMIPCGAALVFSGNKMMIYLIISACSFIAMAVATAFSIQILAYVQKTTPDNMLGKVMSWIMMISICAQPIGQALYGILFEKLPSYAVIFAAVIAAGTIMLLSSRVFRKLEETETLRNSNYAVEEV